MRPATDVVRTFSLYGESEHLPDVMHCETIAERSALHDWELAPHRHDRLHQLLLVGSGSGMARLDDEEATLLPGALVNVPPTHVHAFTFEPGTQGLVVTLADEMVDEVLGRDVEVRRRLSRCWTTAAAPAAAELMARIAEEYATRSSARALILRGLGAALLGHAARQAERLESTPAPPSGTRLLLRFEALLEQHYRDHWQVADYAHELAVSPTHLGRVMVAATGQSPSRLIDLRVVREARRQLAFTHLGVSTIAYMLGFKDPALLSRVFTRVAGCSPSKFRERLRPRPDDQTATRRTG